jgi:hypothetical protein
MGVLYLYNEKPQTTEACTVTSGVVGSHVSDD